MKYKIVSCSCFSCGDFLLWDFKICNKFCHHTLAVNANEKALARKGKFFTLNVFRMKISF